MKLILFFYLISTALQASEYDFDKLYQIALDNNQEIKEIDASFNASEYQAHSAGTLPNPKLTFEVMDYPTESVAGDKYQIAAKEISLSQMIPMWGKRSLMEKVAQKESLAMGHKKRQVLLGVYERLMTLYLDFYLSRQELKLVRDKKEVLESMLAVMRTEYSSGKTGKAELLTLQTEFVMLLGKEIEVESKVAAKRSDLESLLGGSISLKSANILSPNKPKELEVYGDPDKLYSYALKNSPDVLGLRELENAKRDELSMRKRDYFPDIELMAGYKMAEPSMMNPTAMNTARVGIAINIPFWIFSKERNNHNAAIMNHLSASAKRRSSELKSESEIKTLSSSIKMLFKKLNLYDDGLVALAHQSYATNRNAYGAKRVQFSTLLESINRQFDTFYMREVTLAELHKEIASLNRVVGMNLSEELK